MKSKITNAARNCIVVGVLFLGTLFSIVMASAADYGLYHDRKRIIMFVAVFGPLWMIFAGFWISLFWRWRHDNWLRKHGSPTADENQLSIKVFPDHPKALLWQMPLIIAGVLIVIYLIWQQQKNL